MKRHLFILLSLFVQNCSKLGESVNFYNEHLKDDVENFFDEYMKGKYIEKALNYNIDEESALKYCFIYEDRGMANQILEEYGNNFLRQKLNQRYNGHYIDSEASNKLLGIAIIENNEKVINLIINLDREIINRGKEYFIELAKSTNNFNFIKIFVKYLDEDVCQQFISNIALNSEFNDFIHEMLEQTLNVHHIYEYGNTLLHLAVKKNNINLSKWLISKNIDFLVKNNSGYEASDIAKSKKYYEIEQLLNIKIFEVVINKLETLIINYPEQIVKQIFSHLIKYNRQIIDKRKSDSNFFKEITKEYLNTFKQMNLDKIFDDLFNKFILVALNNDDNSTLLHLAAKYNKVELIKYLLSQDIDIFAQNIRGEEALDVARNSGYYEIESILFEKEAEHDIDSIEALFKEKINKK